MAEIRSVNGMLLLFHHPAGRSASTIMEHANSFRRHSRFRVWTVNTALGFPAALETFRFRAVLLHYSLFGVELYPLSDRFLRYLERHEASYTIAFFQDEYQYCQKRFAFLSRLHIDCIYTLLDPAYYQDVYGKYTDVPKLVTTLTGYVSDDLIAKAREFAKPDCERSLDVGYRARQLPFWMGRGSQEKHEIGVRFRERAAGSGLKTDIETDEKRRLYGDAWYRFLGDCKACLGVEAGVSIFDIEDVLRQEHDQLIVENPGMTLEEMSERLLNHWEGNVPYRTVSPRHFEAAAFRVCQILYEGEYQGVMKPMVHYIPLRKDFSNFDEVMHLFRDDDFRHEITDNCYRDLIASGRYSYRGFIRCFDRHLLEAGLPARVRRRESLTVSVGLARHRIRRRLLGVLLTALPVLGRPLAKVYYLIPPLVRLYRWVIQWLKRQAS